MLPIRKHSERFYHEIEIYLKHMGVLPEGENLWDLSALWNFLLPSFIHYHFNPSVDRVQISESLNSQRNTRLDKTFVECLRAVLAWWQSFLVQINHTGEREGNQKATWNHTSIRRFSKIFDMVKNIEYFMAAYLMKCHIEVVLRIQFLGIEILSELNNNLST